MRNPNSEDVQLFSKSAQNQYMTKLSTAYAMFRRQLHFLALTSCDTQHLRRGRDAGTAGPKSTTPVPSKRVRKHGGLTRLPLLEVREIVHLEYILTRYHK